MLVIKVGGGKELNIDAIVSDIVALRQAGRELISGSRRRGDDQRRGRGPGTSASVCYQRERI